MAFYVKLNLAIYLGKKALMQVSFYLNNVLYTISGAVDWVIAMEIVCGLLSHTGVLFHDDIL